MKLLNIDFKSKPVYSDNDKYIKTKIKIYGNRRMQMCTRKIKAENYINEELEESDSND